MKVELNLTERLFASLMGIRATLLRPPYAIDEEPDTADQVKPLEFAQDMGYITVGNRIDPNDWNDKPRRHTAEEISAYVLATLPRAPPAICAAATSCCCMMAAGIVRRRFVRCP